jgi:hypothetical protein
MWNETVTAICLYGLKNPQKNLSQVTKSLGEGLKPGPPEYEPGVLFTRRQHSVG